MARKLDNAITWFVREPASLPSTTPERSDLETRSDARFGAIRLASGNTLIASGGGAGASSRPDGKVVWEIKDAIPGTKVALKWTTFRRNRQRQFHRRQLHAGETVRRFLRLRATRKSSGSSTSTRPSATGCLFAVLSDRQSALVRKLLATPSGRVELRTSNWRQAHAIEIGKHKGFILQPARPRPKARGPGLVRADHWQLSQPKQRVGPAKTARSGSTCGVTRAIVRQPAGGKSTPSFINMRSVNLSLNPRQVAAPNRVG